MDAEPGDDVPADDAPDVQPGGGAHAPRIRALVLAGGAGRRFGPAPKLLAPLGGLPVLEHVLALARPHDPVVVLGAGAAELEASLDLRGIEVVRCEGWAEGQAASLRTGIAALGAVDGALVLLGDQPRLTRTVVDGTIARWRPGAVAVRPSYQGVGGHPVLLGRPALARAEALRGDAGFRAILDEAKVDTWDATGLADPRDVDTPDDLAALG